MDGDENTAIQRVAVGSSLQQGSRRALLMLRGRQDVASMQGEASYQKGLRFYKGGDLCGAAAAFRLAAIAGHAESQYLLSTLLDEAQAFALDADEAARWELCAAKQGHAYAQANVSYRSHSREDFTEAFRWCQRAADKGLAWAQYNLALMYRKGEGTAPCAARAAELLAQAAEQDFVEAQVKLAELYYFGDGMQQSDALAARWYLKAAENGAAEAQYQLGHLYGVGQGVQVDYTRSREWIQRAARQGHAAACSELKRREYRDA